VSRPEQLSALSGLSSHEVMLARMLWPGLEASMSVEQEADYLRRHWANIDEMARLGRKDRAEHGEVA